MSEMIALKKLISKEKTISSLLLENVSPSFPKFVCKYASGDASVLDHEQIFAFK